MIDAIQQLLQQNPIVAGGVGMALTGALLVQARNAPKHIWNLIQDQFSMSMTVFSEDAAFHNLNVWLGKHPSMKKTRRFGTAVYADPRKDKDEFVLTPGAGFHVMRHGKRFFLIHRRIEDSPGRNEWTASRQQTLTMSTFGRKRETMDAILQEAMRVKEDHDTIPVYAWVGGCYQLVERKLKRPLRTIYAKQEIKDDLLADVQRFLASRAWYTERAIPWRRGYMFKGPHGTGKSSLAFAIASEIEKPIYLINPSALDNDIQLQRAVNEAGAGLVLLEDIDSVKATADREEKKEIRRAVIEHAPQALGLVEPPASEGSKSGVTLSGMLNAIDGVAARDGRILIITTNHADLLDAALIRPGRVDKQYLLDHSGMDEALAMFRSFFPGEPVEKFAKEIDSLLPISPADLQNRLLGLAEAAA